MVTCACSDQEVADYWRSQGACCEVKGAALRSRHDGMDTLVQSTQRRLGPKMMGWTLQSAVGGKVCLAAKGC